MKNLIMQITPHVSQIVSSETLSIIGIKDKIKKMGILKIRKESILLNFSYCKQNELIGKQFLAKFHQITNQKFKLFLKRHTLAKKIRMLKFNGMNMEIYTGNLNLQNN